MTCDAQGEGVGADHDVEAGAEAVGADQRLHDTGGYDVHRAMKQRWKKSEVYTCMKTAPVASSNQRMAALAAISSQKSLRASHRAHTRARMHCVARAGNSRMTGRSGW